MHESVESLLIRKKYQLPLFQKIPGKFFNLETLKCEMFRLEEYWTDIYRANQGLCAAHEKLAENNYKHFDQINLTVYPGAEQMVSLEQARSECHQLSQNTRAQFGSFGAYRAKTRNKHEIDPTLDEHQWHVPLPIYKDSEIERQINSNFTAQAIRVRLVRLRAGKTLTPHIDYCPTYAVRVIVPIITHPEVKNIFWHKTEKSEVHLPADGSAYFLNVGFRHSVENRSTIDRYSLMFSLKSQADIQCL